MALTTRHGIKKGARRTLKTLFPLQTSLSSEPPGLYLVQTFTEGIQTGNPLPIRLRSVIDERGDHPDLADSGPGDKRVLFEVPGLYVRDWVLLFCIYT